MVSGDILILPIGLVAGVTFDPVVQVNVMTIELARVQAIPRPVGLRRCGAMESNRPCE
jgi:hypothetical protein